MPMDLDGTMQPTAAIHCNRLSNSTKYLASGPATRQQSATLQSLDEFEDSDMNFGGRLLIPSYNVSPSATYT